MLQRIEIRRRTWGHAFREGTQLERQERLTTLGGHGQQRERPAWFTGVGGGGGGFHRGMEFKCAVGHRQDLDGGSMPGRQWAHMVVAIKYFINSISGR